jgi:hypothetical protein
MARAFSVIATALTALAGASACALGASTAHAQAPGEVVTVVDPIDVPPEHDPLAHAFDLPGTKGGFYLRPSISLGVQNTRLGPASWESDLGGQSANGFATGYGLDIGGFVRPWVALHLDLHTGVLWSGNLDYELSIAGQRGRDVRIIAYGLAPAATFFTPHGFYFKPAFGVGLATLKSGGQSDTTDPGFFMDLVAGKDIYSDRNFSVGLQFEIVYMRLGGDTEAEEARVRQFLFGVSFGFDSR